MTVSGSFNEGVKIERRPSFLRVWLPLATTNPIGQNHCAEALAQDIGLTIQPDRNLPDLILVDLEPVEPLLVFVEVVATAGPVNDARRTALLSLAREAGFREEQVAFVTAYADRDHAAFKGSVSELAWKSFAWFASEPEHIIMLHRGTNADQVRLSDLMRS